MESPEVIEGGIYTDNRGSLFHVNDFHLMDVKRFYIIENNLDHPIRAWQGHKLETKWFYAIKGSFLIGLVKPDNWDNPSKNLIVEKITLKDSESKILKIPPGYANGIRQLENNSKLIVFSNFDINQASTDNHKFDLNSWELN